MLMSIDVVVYVSSQEVATVEHIESDMNNYIVEKIPYTFKRSFMFLPHIID